MLRKLMTAILACAVTTISHSSFALPKIESATRASGVVAFQDENDPKQFHIYPERVPLVLGLTLSDPTVKYWGIGAAFREKEPDYGLWVPIVGGTISGMGTITITPEQENGIREAIKKDFGISDAKLAPLDGKTSRIQPVFAANSIGVGADGDQVFPTEFRFGSSFNFVVGSPRSHTFASYIAQRSIDQPFITPDSSFGINLVSKSQFRGAPWNVKCKADLKKVWKEIRQSYGGSGGYGWFGLSVQYASLQQNLFRSKLIDCNLTEGDLASKEKSEQLFQIAKDALISMNDPDNEYFRFAPNPQAPATGGGASGAWLVSINLAYSEASLKDEIKYEQSFEFNPTIEREMPVSLTLAVKCDVNTEHFFKELEVSQPCITPKKAKFFQEWANRENALKQKKIEEVMNNPSLSAEAKRELVKFYKVVSLSDSAVRVKVTDFIDPETERVINSNSEGYVFVGLSDDILDDMEGEVARGKSIKEALAAVSK
jgi:hypothetical protein